MTRLGEALAGHVPAETYSGDLTLCPCKADPFVDASEYAEHLADVVRGYLQRRLSPRLTTGNPGWRTIADQYKDRDETLAALAAGELVPPFTMVQWDSIRRSVAAIPEDHVAQRHYFLAWLYQAEIREAVG